MNVSKREPPLRGTYVPPVGGDLVDVRWVHVNLDSDPPTITAGKGYTPGKGRWQFPLRVSETEIEVFYILASTETCYCEWTAELYYLADGREGSVIIDNEGEPFVTSSHSNTMATCQSFDGTTLECERS